MPLQHPRAARLPAATDLTSEIRDRLLEVRADRDQEARGSSHEPTPAQVAAYEHGVMLDVTLALMIRHRVRIDARDASLAVDRARPATGGGAGRPDADAWAVGCASHIEDLLRAADERAAEPTDHENRGTP